MKHWNFEEIESARRRPRHGYPDGHTVREFCDAVGCSPETYYSWRRNGEARPITAISRGLEKYVEVDGGA